MTRHTLRQLAVALLAALVVASTLGLGAGVAAAEDGEGYGGGWLDWLGDDSDDTNETDDSGLLSSASTLWESYKGSASGAFARLSNWGDTADATRSADDVQAFVNSHNETIEQYINERTTASTGFDVVAVEFRDESGSDTRYLVADVVDGNYSSGRMVETTERSIDETCELEGQAVANARDELETLYSENINQSSDITTRQLAALNSQYQPDVACSFFLPDL